MPTAVTTVCPRPAPAAGGSGSDGIGTVARWGAHLARDRTAGGGRWGAHDRRTGRMLIFSSPPPYLLPLSSSVLSVSTALLVALGRNPWLPGVRPFPPPVPLAVGVEGVLAFFCLRIGIGGLLPTPLLGVDPTPCFLLCSDAFVLGLRLFASGTSIFPPGEELFYLLFIWLLFRTFSLRLCSHGPLSCRQPPFSASPMPAFGPCWCHII